MSGRRFLIPSPRGAALIDDGQRSGKSTSHDAIQGNRDGVRGGFRGYRRGANALLSD
jgi:hypothetical protein